MRSASNPRKQAALLLALVCLLGTAGAIGGEKNIQAVPKYEPLNVPKLARAVTFEDFENMAPSAGLAGQMLRIDDFRQRDPQDGAPVSQRTEVFLGYTDKHLYVVFLAFDDQPQNIRARMERRELIDDDDQVGFVLDTFQDKRNGVFFYMNPLGIQQDGVWVEGKNPDYSYDMVWNSKAKLTGRGYVAWFEIPFKNLRFPARPQQTWGLFFERDIRRNSEFAFYPHISSNRQGFLPQQTSMRGIENISPGRNLQFIPYVSYRAYRTVDERFGIAPRFTGKRAEPNMGLDSKIVLWDSLVLDTTINPDFAQVESDEPQTVANQRFEVFFPEKRPFFLENSGYFDTPIDLVFTRRIADPAYGVRLTGKLGRWAIGTLFANDESPGKTVYPTDPLYGAKAYFGVLRVRRDVGKDSSIGLIYTDREMNSDPNTECDLNRCIVESNRVGGVDLRLRFKRNWRIDAQALASSTRYNDGSYYAGPAYHFYIQRSSRKTEWNLMYKDTSAGFETHTGFFRRPDERRISQFAMYRFRPEGKWLQWHGPSWFSVGNWDHSGQRLEYGHELVYRWVFARQSDAGVVAYAGDEHLKQSDYDTLPSEGHTYPKTWQCAWVNTSYFKAVRLSADNCIGRGVNFDPADGVPAPARFHQGRMSATVRPIRGLTVENSWTLLRMRSPQGPAIANDHILRSKWNYQFTREFSVRLIGQYNATLTNSALSALTPAKRFAGDFLFTYLPHPGTAVYVGYSSGMQNYERGLHLDSDGEIIRTRRAFINDGRQVFVKLSYLFRF